MCFHSADQPSDGDGTSGCFRKRDRGMTIRVGVGRALTQLVEADS